MIGSLNLFDLAQLRHEVSHTKLIAMSAAMNQEFMMADSNEPQGDYSTRFTMNYYPHQSSVLMVNAYVELTSANRSTHSTLPIVVTTTKDYWRQSVIRMLESVQPKVIDVQIKIASSTPARCNMGVEVKLLLSPHERPDEKTPIAHLPEHVLRTCYALWLITRKHSYDFVLEGLRVGRSNS
jgi:hypothetical protein